MQVKEVVEVSSSACPGVPLSARPETRESIWRNSRAANNTVYRWCKEGISEISVPASTTFYFPPS